MNQLLCDGAFSVDLNGFIKCDGSLSSVVFTQQTSFEDLPLSDYGEIFFSGFTICFMFWAVGYGARKVVDAIR